jgi:hypothetical protein
LSVAVFQALGVYSDRQSHNMLRVCPETLGRIADFSEHEAINT